LGTGPLDDGTLCAATIDDLADDLGQRLTQLAPDVVLVLEATTATAIIATSARRSRPRSPAVRRPFDSYGSAIGSFDAPMDRRNARR
jgi:hypothetical protein